jgi:uncharacterized protein with PIN domain
MARRKHYPRYLKDDVDSELSNCPNCNGINTVEFRHQHLTPIERRKEAFWPIRCYQCGKKFNYSNMIERMDKHV